MKLTDKQIKALKQVAQHGSRDTKQASGATLRSLENKGLLTARYNNPTMFDDRGSHIFFLTDAGIQWLKDNEKA